MKLKKIIAAIAAAAVTVSVMAFPSSAQPVGISSDSVSAKYPVFDNSKNFSAYGLSYDDFYKKCVKEFGESKVSRTPPSADDNTATVNAPFVLPGFGEAYATYTFTGVKNSNGKYSGGKAAKASIYIEFADEGANEDEFNEIVGNAFDGVFGKPSKTGRYYRKWTNVGIDKVNIEACTPYTSDQRLYIFYVDIYPGNYTSGKTSTATQSSTGKLAAPANVKAAASEEKVTLSWSKVSGAKAYRVYKYNPKTGKYVKYKDVTGTKCTVTGLKAGTKYKFKVYTLASKNGKYVQQKASKVVSCTTKEYDTNNITM